ncbi:MAG: beta-lactamase family protein [Acidobacteria bacterium]|jgi:CubicO group peptidase (beta-lactamase class C family)|nr:beta-lactamase family protein [Acidobacteriota bacterium]HPB29161.1 serine hydrolase domain-containing protein [Acidobacteriota bacterium]
MHTPYQIRIVVVILTLALAGWFAPAQESLNRLLQPYLAAYEIPALAAAVVQDGQVIAVGAVGTRRWGEAIPVTLDDRFHLGSDTKAMTATMAAILVERGKLRWDSTIGEVFPELGDGADPVFKALTVERMLSHTSGLPSDNLSKEARPYLNYLTNMDGCPPGNLDDIRAWLVGQWAALPMSGRPGVRFEYSNLNYTIVGAMIERLAGRSWDELIVEWIFEPLALRTAGLGPQCTLGRVDAPLPHAFIGGKIKPMLAGPMADNPAVIGPAGIAHMSVLDFARWAGWNAGQGKRGPALVRPETLKKLHTMVAEMPPAKDAPIGTPPSGRYAFGWGEMRLEGYPNPLIFHGGSNGMNIARILFDPAADFAVVILTNIATPKCDGALKALTRELIDKYAGRSSRPAAQP